MMRRRRRRRRRKKGRKDVEARLPAFYRPKNGGKMVDSNF
jgi:hypothetical protein